MEPNLFYSMFKYRATRDRGPLEDYFTELLGFLFNFDKELASAWMREIPNGSFNPNPYDLKVATQYSLGKFGRADIVLFWTERGIRKSLLIENKIESPIGERGYDESREIKTQIRNYIDYQTEKGSHEDHKVALCKKSPMPTYSDLSPYFLGEVTWTQFYKFLDNFVKTECKSNARATTKFLCEQILHFMRRYNMAFENFTVQDLASLNPYEAFKSKLNKLTEKIQADFSKTTEYLVPIIGHSYKAWGAYIIDEHWGLIISNNADCTKASIWLNIGFSMVRQERSFAPLILRDERIPDVQVMLGLWPNPENMAKVMEAYGDNIHGKLNGYLGKSPIADTYFEKISNETSFLCFYFRKPLSDFLKYQDQESEVIKFLDDGIKAISNLAEDGILSNLVNDSLLR